MSDHNSFLTVRNPFPISHFIDMPCNKCGAAGHVMISSERVFVAFKLILLAVDTSYHDHFSCTCLLYPADWNM